MSDSLTVSTLVDGISKNLKAILSRSRLTEGFLNRYAYPRIIAMQRNRWVTENDGQWAQLKSESYKRYKLKRFANFPGSGTKLMIASNQLFAAVVGDDMRHHRKIVSGSHLEIDIVVDSYSKKGRQSGKRSKEVTGSDENELPPFTYAGFVNAKRNYTDITPAAKADIKAAYARYMMKGTG